MQHKQANTLAAGARKRRSTLAKDRPSIALMTNYPYDGVSVSGGVETATIGLLEGLRAYVDEFDFHVIALAREIDAHRVERRDGMTYHFLAIPSSPLATPHVVPNIINARRCLKNLNPDLVHCQDNMALAIGAMTAKPARKIFTVHGIKAVESRVWEGPEYWSHQMDAMLERWVRKHFDEVITISPYVDSFLPMQVKKHHIANPVRRLFFEQPQTGAGDARRLLFVGALTRLKRPMDIVRALEIVQRRIPDVRLTVVGAADDGEYVNEMKQFIAERDIRSVAFLGSKTQHEVAALMRESAALVLPSVQENTPMAIAEAMASGLPVIASSVGGIPFMVAHDVDGLLFECGNVGELARNIINVMEDRTLRLRLSRSGREKADRRFSSEAVAAATVAVYRTMLGV
jgi:glycosyltransferase involved in cell wall biosynthesis